MSDDFEDRPRGKKNKGSGDNTLKIVLIVFASFFGLMFVVCCGGGAYLFYVGKRFVEQAAMTKPADIQKLTTEMTDITIPPEFIPQHGSSIAPIKMKMVQYAWCATGNCPAGGGPVVDPDNLFMLTSFDLGENQGAGTNVPDVSETALSDSMLKSVWKEFTKTEHTLTIRGKPCKFTIIAGEEFASRQFGIDDDEAMPAETEPATDSEPASESEDTPAEENMPEKPPAANQPGTGKKIVQISGSFPGKEAQCTLQIRLKAVDYQEEKILEMLKSIK